MLLTSRTHRLQTWLHSFAAPRLKLLIPIIRFVTLTHLLVQAYTAATQAKKGETNEGWSDANDSWRRRNRSCLSAGCCLRKRTGRASTETAGRGRCFQERAGSPRDSGGRVHGHDGHV